jgi:deoxyribose-phosphate aldolase
VCVQPHFVHLASQLLSGSHTLPITVIGFPLGNNTSDTKVFEAQNAASLGAQEIDIVINLAALKSKDFDFALDDVKKVVECVDEPVKVIIETSLLTFEEKVIATAIVEEADADFIKTSTGFSGAGAQIEDVHLFYHLLEDRVAIKASGGIKNKTQAFEFLKAGCERLGTSSGAEIIAGKTTEGY